MSMNAQLKYLTDRAELTDVIGQYCFGMDTRDWTLYRDCWTDDMSVDLIELSGSEAGISTIKTDDWVDAIKAFFSEIPLSQHLKKPVKFEIDGDSATVLSIMQGKHWMPNRKGDVLSTNVGYYRDRFVRTERGWKMFALKELIHWHEGNVYVSSNGQAKLIQVLRDRYPQIDWDLGMKTLMAGV